MILTFRSQRHQHNTSFHTLRNILKYIVTNGWALTIKGDAKAMGTQKNGGVTRRMEGAGRYRVGAVSAVMLSGVVLASGPALARGGGFAHAAPAAMAMHAAPAAMAAHGAPAA